MKQKNAYSVKPTQFAACVELAKGSAVAGGLLCQLTIRSQKGTLKDHHGVDGWVAMSSEQWRATTGYSRNQHNDAVSKLKKAGLVQQMRRRIGSKDRAAIAWLRIPESVKAAIAEIMSRPAILAFSEKTPIENSEYPENTAIIKSENPEALVLKEKIEKKENVLENVVIAKTTKSKTSKTHSKETKHTQKNWFNQIVKRIYEGTAYAPEPFNPKNVQKLREAVEYLASNPAGYFEYCTVNEEYHIIALRFAVCNWPKFCDFVIDRYNAFSLPNTPTLWSLSHQLKGLPEFVKYQRFQMDMEGLAKQLERDLSSSAYSPENFEIYTSVADKSAIIKNLVGKYSTENSSKKWQEKFKQMNK